MKKNSAENANVAAVIAGQKSWKANQPGLPATRQSKPNPPTFKPNVHGKSARNFASARAKQWRAATK